MKGARLPEKRTFQQGDTVALRTDGPEMLVISTQNNDKIVLCQFFLRSSNGDYTSYHREKFPPGNLRLVAETPE